MKTRSEIRYDFRQAQKRAQELEDMAGILKKLSEEKLDSVLWQLSSAWTGEAADTYRKKGKQLQEHMLKNAERLESIASTIQSTAQKVYDAEMKAYRRAIKRDYYD